MVNSTVQEYSGSKSFFGRSRLILALSLAVILVLGLGIRFYDLTDAPMDFHPTRQIRGLVIARGMYYQMLPSVDPAKRDAAIAYWGSMVDREPQILERVVALTYLAIGQEQTWIARIYTSLAWIIGGLFLFALARRMVSADGAVVATAFYLFLPFGVIASRSFQPDPVMVMLFLISAYVLYRWSEAQTWKWAVLTAVLVGIAVFYKVVIAFLAVGMVVGVVLHLKGFKRSLADAQVWTIGLLMVVPAALYYLVGIQNTSANFLEGSTLSLLQLILSPSYYMRWAIFLHGMFGLSIILVSLAGMLVSKPLNRSMLLGLWVGYGIYGISFPHHITTHEYYHLQLIPIVALSLTPIGDFILSKIAGSGGLWQFMALGVMVIGAAYPLFITRSVLAGQDFRAEATYWRAVGEAIPDNGKTIALTQNYGHYLMYYGWEKVKLWPTTGEIKLAQTRG
ncbi:MAG TPA: glycosyltransferase family 39 protein, partial [Anaerolineales bacterium]|nr:glycosyltransferase family 39 protein [Anaerolineales bacterium]